MYVIVMPKYYTLIDEYCENCGIALTKELDENNDNCKLCRNY